MIPLSELWLPILISAVLVFLASSLIHMLLTYHRSDFGPLPDEERAMEVLGALNIPPGEYAVPYAATPKEMGEPAYTDRMERGPVAFLNVRPSGMEGMGKYLAQWFVYCLIVGIFAAYIAGRALGPGAEYLEVFRFAGTTAFAAYALALWQESIWYKRAWSTTFKNTFDGLIYALLTGGVFGWLWPG